MDFFTILGLLLILYLFLYLVMLSFADCDLGLLWAEKFGVGLGTVKGKVVWITGASSGIGEHLAVVLARHGAKLVLSAKTIINLERVKQKCLECGLHEDDVLVLPLDITEIAKHEQHFTHVLKHFGKLDILVNNAGRSQRASWEQIELEVDRQLFELNVFSVVSLSRLAVRYFRDRGHGHVVVTSSLAGVVGAPFSASYTAAKHAIHGYFDTLRNEKLDTFSLTVTLLCPGPVFSNILTESFTTKSGEKFNQPQDVNDRRMRTERCAELCAVAIANKLDEVWMGLFPIVPLCYVLVYCPNVARRISGLLKKKSQQLRDGRETVNED